MVPFTDNIAQCLNDKSRTDIIYFDFAKAFDSVNHDIILYKLKHQFKIDGMFCKNGCVYKVNSAITSIEGVTYANVDFETGILSVEYDPKRVNDDLIIKKNCSHALIKLHEQYKSSVIASKKVNRKNVSRWGILDIKKTNKKNFIIKDIVEKPSIKSSPSNYAVIGRYILPKKIFKILQNQKTGQNDEIHITDAIKTLISKKNKFIGHIFAGKYLDCGTMKGYINSTIEISKL